MEASLTREKEFNADNRRINAEYLVNVLRKFLMSTHPTERHKLVQVLCTLLHLRPDESKIISDKWAVRSNGLVGWLMPTPAVDNRMGNSEGGNKKPAVIDATYDPVTGSGVDFDIY